MFTLFWISALFNVCQMEVYFCTYKPVLVFPNEAFIEYVQLQSLPRVKHFKILPPMDSILICESTATWEQFAHVKEE